MEKYNTIVKIEEIKRLTENGETERAVKAADSVDVSRLRTVSDLSIVGEAYIRGREYEKARGVYERLYEKSRSRRVVMQLVNLSVKLKDVEAAEDYLQDFMDIAPDDFYRFIFRYSIDKLRGEPYEVLIDSLERLKKKEYIEKWAYELAKLYHKAGMDQKCVDECSDIMLWFGDGQYVERAKALRSYYYGELDLGWLEESKLMETRPIPPLNLAPPKEPIPFKRPAAPEPSKDERFERKMTGGYVSPIGSAGSAARPSAGEGGGSADRMNPAQGREQEPLPVIQTEGLFDEADPIRIPEEPAQAEQAEKAKKAGGRYQDLADRERLFKAAPVVPEGGSELENETGSGNELENGRDSSEEAAAAREPEREWGRDTLVEEIKRKEREEQETYRFGQNRQNRSAAVREWEEPAEQETSRDAGRYEEQDLSGDAGQYEEQDFARYPEQPGEEYDERTAREVLSAGDRRMDSGSENGGSYEPEGRSGKDFTEDEDEQAGKTGRPQAGDEAEAVREEQGSAGKVLEFPTGRENQVPEPEQNAQVQAVIEMFRDSLEDQGLSFENLFGIYSRIPGLEGSLAGMLEDTVTGEAVQYNYRIVGEKSTGKTALAKNISKYLYKTGCITTPKVALISAEKLNRINLIQKKEALADCCLIVEGAGSLNTSAAAGLAHVIRTFNGRLAVILEDTKENMDRLAMDREPLMRLFKPAVSLPEYTAAELAEFVAGFLAEKGFHLLPGAKEALISSLGNKAGQKEAPMNLELAKQAAESAIERAERRNQVELLKFAESGELGKADLEGIAAEDF